MTAIPVDEQMIVGPAGDHVAADPGGGCPAANTYGSGRRSGWRSCQPDLWPTGPECTSYLRELSQVTVTGKR